MTIQISKSKVFILGALLVVLALSVYKDGSYLLNAMAFVGVTINDTKGDGDTIVTPNIISDIDSVTNKSQGNKVISPKTPSKSPSASPAYDTKNNNSIITSPSTPTPSHKPSSSPNPTLSKTPTPTQTKTPTPSPAVTPTRTPTPSPTPTPMPQSFPALSVVINEVAWMGTESSYTDEWIELHNNTDALLYLDGWTLKSITDGSPEIILTGTIAAKGYYLIERTNDSVVANISADLISSFGKGGLNNSGEVLVLFDASGTEQDRTAQSGEWPAGDNVTKSTMARIDSMSPGSSGNWASHQPSIGEGLDASGAAINGSPKTANRTP